MQARRSKAPVINLAGSGSGLESGVSGLPEEGIDDQLCQLPSAHGGMWQARHGHAVESTLGRWRTAPCLLAVHNPPMNTLAKLELPKRWEFLEQRAQEAGLEAAQFVERVDSAADRIDYLLQRVKTGGGGLFEVFFGLSGSGKTTFLKTLPRHFEQIRVLSFPKDASLKNLPKFILDMHVPGYPNARIVLIERRDNPSQADLNSLTETLAELLETFRDPRGATLVLWPVTREESAKRIAAEAWTTGRDSMTDTKSRGLYQFSGLPKERFYPVADTTSRNLTGDGLDAFGVTPEVANGLLTGADTIADFFNAVDLFAESQREKTWSVLKTKVRARLWVVLPGDVPSAIRATVSSLTQGTRNRVDIDLIAEFIDQPDNKAVYVADWKARRPAMAHLLRAIDLRLFGLPPNVSLAAIRSMADDPTSMRTSSSSPAMKLEDASQRCERASYTRLFLRNSISKQLHTPGRTATSRKHRTSIGVFRRWQQKVTRN